MDKRPRQLLPFFFWPVIASGISFAFHVDLLGSVLVFLAVPAFYLSFKLRRMVPKALLFSLATSIPIGIVWDYIAHLTHQWFATTAFPIRLLGLVPFEDLLWGLVLTYTVIMFYEYFLDRHHEKTRWHPRMTFLAALLVLLLGLFLVVHYLSPRLLLIPYSYLWLGICVLMIPSVIELLHRPILLSKFIMTGMYFFFLNLVYEITALKLGLWNFPSTQYIGLVTIAGVHFPVEEFFLMLSAIAILSYYEPFDDDEK